ncbi:MAG: hypothetical protein ACYC96_11930 [Fimbriimonadaceae bacterium]
MASTALVCGVLSASGHAQLITGLTNTSSSQAYDRAGNTSNIYAYDYHSQTVLGSLNGNSSASEGTWSTAFGDGTAGSPTGPPTGEAATTLNTYTSDSSSATYFVDLTSRAGLSSTATTNNTGFANIDASSVGSAKDDLQFTVNHAMDMGINLVGTATVSTNGTANYGIQCYLYDDKTATYHYFYTNGQQTFSGMAELVAGDQYDLVGSDFSQGYYNLNGGLDLRGTVTSELKYTASFAPPAGTPEPITLGLGVVGVGTFLRRRMKSKA